MIDPAPPARIATKDLITIACAVVGAVCVIAGGIRRDGQTDERINTAEKRIETVESHLGRADEADSDLKTRVTRLETRSEMQQQQAHGK